MRTVLSTMAGAMLIATLANSANAAMMMHHKKMGHHMMVCKGEFMMMDKKTHKCMDARG